MNFRAQRFLLLTAAFLISASAAMGESPSDYFYAAPASVPAPTDWKSSNNDVIRKDAQDRDVLSIVGNGGSTEWLSAPISFESRKAYRLRFKASVARDGSGDCFCAGTPFANFDFAGIAGGETPEEERSFVFFVPDGKDGRYDAPARFAQWNTRREYCVAEPSIAAVAPIYRRVVNTAAKDEKELQAPLATPHGEALLLGDGESVDESGVYRFEAFKSRERSNCDRTLYSTTSGYNTNRWTVGLGAEIVYHFSLIPHEIVVASSRPHYFGLRQTEPVTFESGRVNVSIGYSVAGKTIVEASLDGENWTTLGDIIGLGTRDFDLQPVIGDAPRSDVYVRLVGAQVDNAGGCSVQVHGFGVELKTVQGADRRFVGRGETLFADLANAESAAKTNAIPQFFDDDAVYSNLLDHANYPLIVESPWNVGAPWNNLSSENDETSLTPGKYVEWRYALNYKRHATIIRPIFPFFIQNYTSSVLGIESNVDDPKIIETSWCDADYHVPRDPKVCAIQAERRIELFAAQNDYESFQLVLRPKIKDWTNLQASVVETLTTQDGATIADENVALRYAYYHYVDDPTDTTCAPGFYPDALIPFSAGADGRGSEIKAEANRNFLVWVTVKVPEGATPGKYKGKVAITGKIGDLDYKTVAPFEVNVWNVALPEKNTIETAYGSSPSGIWRYHNCTSEADKRAIFDKYLQLYGDYRMSIYTPAPLDPIRFEVVEENGAPKCKFDFTDFDREMKRVFDKYHFTNFRLDFEGLGGGTFAARYEGKFGDYKAGTPEYDAIMTDYGKQLQEHLRETGLLDAAFVYCFDEPEEKDYEFVAGEFAKLKKYAPDITRMLTEEPTPKFEKVLEEKNAKVDVWCPISNCYSEELSKTQRENNSRFWWYVCTGPKAPYCTEFTDHPAQELRIWHWQAFERDIVGSLIWETTYWNSPTLFGNGAQNPYLDPMCYMTGYGLPAGTKRPWGNGDGRFVYPPLTAATPGMNDGKPVMDAPNASIRLEMIRAGVQDYELMLIFKSLLKEKAESLDANERARYEALLDFDEITTDMTHFASDPQILLKRRCAIGEAIQTLKSK